MALVGKDGWDGPSLDELDTSSFAMQGDVFFFLWEASPTKYGRDTRFLS